MLVGQLVHRNSETQVGEARKQGGEDDLQLQPGQGLPEALVHTEAEGHVVVRAAVDVELVRDSNTAGPGWPTRPRR